MTWVHFGGVGVSGTGYIMCVNYTLLSLVYLVNRLAFSGLLTILYTIRKSGFLQNNFISTSTSYPATKGLFYSHMGWVFFKPNYERIHLVDYEDLDNDPSTWIQIVCCFAVACAQCAEEILCYSRAIPGQVLLCATKRLYRSKC